MVRFDKPVGAVHCTKDTSRRISVGGAYECANLRWKNERRTGDGDRGFCSATVLLLLDNMEARRLAFCPLQSDFAHALRRDHGVDQVDFSTAYFFDGTRSLSVAVYHLRNRNVSSIGRRPTRCSVPR